METETEPYVRLASLRELHQVVAQLNTARSMADTLQTIADGTVKALGFELAAVNLVRPDGDLLVAAVAGNDSAEAALAGRTGSRESWERRLEMAERWGELRFIPYTEGWALDDDVPQWHTTGPAPRHPDEWHPMDRLYAPMFASDGELLAVLEVDKPRNGRRPGSWGCEALQLYASQAAIAISNARLRGNMQRALVRLEREQQALRASEESFRQAFEYAPSGMAIAEVGGDNHGRLIRVNDALCRLLGRPVAMLRRYSFSDLVHPEDTGVLLRTSAEGGRAELRLARRDGSYVWVSLRNSVVADAADGPQVLLTHVEDIEERKRHELALAHRASHDSLTGLPNSAELRARLGARICDVPPDPYGRAAPHGADQATDAFRGLGTPGARPFDHHEHVYPPEARGGDGKGLAVLFCDLDGFKSINDRFGHVCGDAVLVEVARRLEQGVRDNDTVARLGGDEFVVLAEGLGPAEASDLAVRLRNGIIPPIRVEGRAVRVGASFGIGWASCGMSTAEILESADQRMYIEKRSRSQGRRRAG
ncbi:diguanylate cyclase CdgB [Streptomyces hoynatensis]|uniref:Diguanylate cyclase n=1 Tax=Streptomyces hoynatensis TaxID=1141874 RepID=A0A3A9Z358_9ACTN|nr:diguanylate cyclase CdgB [Streptomyces hoynatensis]RKN41757.1 diguanylate cyclase [Streptomyces hoynatensis]